MKNKKILLLPLITLVLLLLNINIANASTSSLKASNESPTVGESVTVTASATTGTSQLTLSGNGETKALVIGDASTAGNETGSVSITFTPTEATSYTFTLTGNMTDFDTEEKENVNKSITITAKAKEEPKQEEPKQETPETPAAPATTTETETKTEEPKTTKISFAISSGTVYTTVSDLNFRSTSDGSVIGSIDKVGTELKVTGIAEDKTRVEYNGKEGYVASKYVSSEKPEEKSNNANLKSLTVEEYELTPKFAKDTGAYAITVPSTVEKLTVKAEVEDSKAKVEIKGNEGLKEGENTVAISVNAEDGTIKIYEIKVTKEAAGEVLGLKSLTIKDTDISKNFKPEVYTYKINIPNVDALEIEAIANQEKAKVEIKGNKDLKDGENIITITVTSEKGDKKVSYQIKATKGAVTTKTEEKSSGISPKVYLYGAIALIVIAAIVIAAVYFIKHRKKEEMEFSDNIDEDNKDNNDEIDLDKKPKIDYYMENKENNIEANMDNSFENSVENMPENNTNSEMKIEKIENEINSYINDNNNNDNDNDNDDDLRHKRGRHF